MLVIMFRSPGVPLRRAVLTLVPGADFQAMSVFFLKCKHRQDVGFQNVYICYLKEIYKSLTKVLIKHKNLKRSPSSNRIAIVLIFDNASPICVLLTPTKKTTVSQSVTFL